MVKDISKEKRLKSKLCIFLIFFIILKSLPSPHSELLKIVIISIILFMTVIIFKLKKLKKQRLNKDN